MGVIAYVLLAGYPPFYEEDQMKLFRKIKSGQYYFHQERWNKHTPESMDMIRKMLCVDQKARWTAQQLLDHPWMRMGEDLLAARDLSMSRESLKKYVAKQRMRRAANAIIAMRRLSIHSHKSDESTRRDSSMQTSSMTPDSSAPNSAPPSAPTSTFTTPSPSMSAPAEGDAAAAAAHEDHGHDLMHGDAHAHLPVGIGRTVLSEGHIVFKCGLEAIHHDHDEDFPAVRLCTALFVVWRGVVLFYSPLSTIHSTMRALQDERAARPPADFF
jgi:serine/threonine protein kinase